CARSPHRVVPAAHPHHRCVRHEHQGPAVQRHGGGVPVGGGPHGGVGARGLSGHAADGHLQALIGVGGLRASVRVMTMRIAASVLSFVAVVGTVSAALAGAKDESAAEWLFPKVFNDWRNSVADRGLALGGTYVGDNIANVTGGISRGAIHFGRLDLSADADLEKLFGWSGAKFHGNTFSIYGRGLTRNYIGNRATVSEIEARPDVRLYEAYIEQSLWGGALTIKAGQQAADVEFFDSQTDDLFINGTFGWPAIKASNLPAGGPAPPIAVP